MKNGLRHLPISLLRRHMGRCLRPVAEDMGLELRRLLAQTVEMKGGLSLYSDGM